MAAVSSPMLPGRLGTPAMVLAQDPRADPRMLAAMAPFALDQAPAAAGVDGSSSLEQVLDFCAGAEPGFEGLFGALAMELAPLGGITKSVEVIKGIDGNDITLFIHRPTGVDGPLPAILHLHGGGMVILEAAGTGYDRWRDELAATGLSSHRRRVPQRSGQAGPPSVPSRVKRLHVSVAVGDECKGHTRDLSRCCFR